MKNINIYDVAKKARVSISTVSRVVNDYSYIKAKTRDRVIKTINEMNYQPSSMAQMLGSGKVERLTKKDCITVVISESLDINSQTFYGYLTGIIKGADELGLKFFTDRIKTDYRETVDLPRSIKDDATDGVIIISKLNPKFIIQLKSMKIPVVAIGKFYVDLGIDMVFTDDFKGSYKAVKYLIGMGHKKICHLGGPDYTVSNSRFEGYRAALIDGGIGYNENLVIRCDDREKISPETAMNKILDRSPDITAVFCWNDWTALKAKEVISGRDLKIPDDISLVGYDNIEVSGQMQPGLTTVSIPREKIGRHSLKRLNELTNGIDTESMITELPTVIIERNSVKKIS